ncbi:MAG: hypothetical protein CL908_02980 [Deltaproteobacteria bacterium]|nr:hypothetical protein [Deltaproteobacteria bacterium]
MAGQGRTESRGAGPGNKRIATTLLELLAVRGRGAAGERARRALGLGSDGEGGLLEAGSWLADGTLAEMFVAADADTALARAVGHRLAVPDATGLRLYGLGLATPEKAYRRIQSLLPRESLASLWSVEEIGSGRARLRFEASEARTSDASPDLASAGALRGEEALCALRVGMLEAIPGLYGLLPARVTQSSCLAEGADACRYEVAWQRGAQVGFWAGTGLGLGVAAGLGAVSWLVGPVLSSSAAVLLCAVFSLVLGPALGRTIDLHRQLAAVAGARRGHLSLFDQVDDALATKLDALARADAHLDPDGAPSLVRHATSEPAGGVATMAGQRAEARSAAHAIHAAAGDLECFIEKWGGSGTTASSESLGDARLLVREIRAWAARIATDGVSEEEVVRRSVRLSSLVERAIATARPTLDTRAKIEVDAEEGLAPILCDPVQIEQLVVQLVRNAVDASQGLSEMPEVFVRLRSVPHGTELAVEDRGVGIDGTEVDEVFDPFFDDRRTGIEDGFGLPVCLRIAERHGAELRIEAEDRPGTRVSVVLPRAPLDS